MWHAVSIFVLCSVGLEVLAQYDNSCQTPNGEWAYCKSIYDCPPLLKVVQTRNAIQLRFLKESQCGYNVNPLVCCGTADTYVSTTTTRRPTFSTGQTQLRSNSAIPDRSSCGFQEPEKIFNGDDAALEDYPWMALLQYRNRTGGVRWACGGSLINDRYILTAAHCVTGDIITKVGTLVSARLGEWNTDTDEDCVTSSGGRRICVNKPVQNIDVEDTIPHENYDNNDYNRYNDIALVRLKRRVTFNNYVRPICLPQASESSPVGSKLVVAGWGRTESRSRSPIKQKLEVPVAEKRECSSTFSTAGISLRDSQICAGGEAGKDSCTGDSGGPLMNNAKNDSSQWYIEGIVSFGAKCGTEGWPGIYTRVASHLAWIHSKVRP